MEQVPRQQYTKEFREQAVRLVLEQQVTIPEGACKINCVTGYHASSREEGGFDDQARYQNGCVAG